MIKEHYLNNDLIDVPLDFYDIDKSKINENLNYKETYIIHNGYATPSFNHNVNDSFDVIEKSKRFCDMNESKFMKSLYKENYLNNDIRDVPFNYYPNPSKHIDLTDLDESKLIKYLYKTHEVKNNKEKFVKNDIIDIPLSYYHIDTEKPEQHINYKEDFDNKLEIREIPVSYYRIRNFNDNKYINYN